MTAERVGCNTVAQDLTVTIGGTHIKHAVIKVGPWVQFTMTGGEGAFGCCDNATVSGLLKHSLSSWVTFGTGISFAAIATHHTRDRDLPRFPKGVHVFGELTVRLLEVIVAITVEVAAQAAGLFPVVSRYGDRDVVDQVIGEEQTKVCSDGIVGALFVDLNGTVIQT